MLKHANVLAATIRKALKAAASRTASPNRNWVLRAGSRLVRGLGISRTVPSLGVMLERLRLPKQSNPVEL